MSVTWISNIRFEVNISEWGIGNFSNEEYRKKALGNEMLNDSGNALRNTLGMFGKVLQECDRQPIRECLLESYKETYQKRFKEFFR